ncbi:response regulator [Maridesulfovibrio zosterae]|uniref:response regulator n=1 Tax=Maridesulfovibrio zosterae TaxID=82171 RepID=UPI0004853ED1|nr:response regulator [Maridesulfovibrio zosterae]
MRILVVEDSKTSRMYLLEILKTITSKNTTTDYAVSGEEALAKYETSITSGEGYDLIFMDIILPGIDGLQTLEKIRNFEQKNGWSEEQKSKVIITSVVDDEIKVSRAFFQCGAISYMTKPITADKIKSEMNKFGLI